MNEPASPAAASAALPAAPAAAEAIPKRRFDLRPLAVMAALALAAWPAVGSSSTWLTLTIAGLAMGMIIFIAASGLTLVFGLMDVLNFGHSLFIALGAYVATSVFTYLGDWASAASVAQNLGAIAVAMLAAMAARGRDRPGLRARHRAPGLRPAPEADPGHDRRRDHRRGADQGRVGPAQIPLPPPEALRGSILIGDATASRSSAWSRSSSAWSSSLALLYTLNRTKIGLLIRAGVQDREMVESLGYRIRRLFVGVFAAGSALAGLGGCLWGMNQQIVVPQIGGQVNVLLFIVIIIGGLGSTVGCLVGALLVGLMTNYVGFLAPKLAMFSSIGLMVAVLLWRPQGLYPVTSR